MDSNQNPLMNIVQLAEQKGKATGVITSVEWSHATPAAMVAHNVSRNNYAEIGREMVYASGLDVIMGAGHPYYGHDGEDISANPNTFKYVGGEDTWNDLANGTAGNDADGDGEFDAWTFIECKEDFEKLTVGPTPKRVLGTAKVYQTLQYNRSGQTQGKGPAAPNTTDAPYTVLLVDSVPTLETMTKAALNILDNDEDGFFLMIEGGAVDWAGHGNTTARLIEEQIDFNKSVDAVVRWVNMNSNWDETIVIVTGDHETGYLTGPGSGTDDAPEGIETPTWTEPVNHGQGNLPDTEWHSGDHTNLLIPLYAKGSGSELLHMFADEEDERKGYFLDNAEVGQMMIHMMHMNDAGSFVVLSGVFEITTIADIPNDQGKQVRIGWSRHPNDTDGSIAKYSLFRKIDHSLRKSLGKINTPDGDWELVKEVSAVQMDKYFAIVPTLADSSEKYGKYLSTFFVMASTNDPTEHFATEPAVGYSIDNIGPPVVEIIIIRPGLSGGNYIQWTMASVPDLDHYEIYRSENQGFEPKNENLIAKTKANEFVDKTAQYGVEYYYKVASCDQGGNKTFSVIGVVTNVEDLQSVPTEFRLAQNFPNPFNPQTTIKYSIPKAGHVKLTVYDALGNEVAQLVDSYTEVGNYSVNWNAESMTSGIYVYKLESGSKVLTQKMLLVK